MARRGTRRKKRTHRFNKRHRQTVPLNTQAKILAGLNVLSVLEAHARKYLGHVLWHGADSFAGDGWASVLVWYRAKGLHTMTYQTLTLLGVWAVAADATTILKIGAKPLQYTAPVYNAEAYFQLIQRGFKTYYSDSGSPPSEKYIQQTLHYDPTQRLALRDSVSAALKAYLVDLHTKTSS